MLIQLFKPLEVGDSFQRNKIGDITKYSSFSYEKNFYSFGTFNLKIPIGTRFANLIEEDTLLFVDYKYWLIVRDIVGTIGDSAYEFEISGTDLKGMVNDKITLYASTNIPGAQGYDVATGSSESIMKHYVDFNLINPSDADRKVIGLVNSQNKNRGVLTDTYMSRFEKVSDVLAKVGTNAKLGYDITVDLDNNRMVFDVLDSVDKTEKQSIRNRVVFDILRGNVKDIRADFKSSMGKNTFYATKSGGSLETDAITQLVVDGEIKKGIHRREMQLNVSCDSVDEIELYAKKDIGNYANIFSLEQRVTAKGFGTLFDIGDIVTVKNYDLNLTHDVQIIGAKISLDDLVLVFNQKPVRPLELINQKLKNKGV